MPLALLAFIAVFILLVSCGLLFFYRDVMAARLETLVGAEEEPQGAVARLLRGKSAASVETIVKPFQNVLPRSAQEVSVLQKRLIRAGYRKPSNVNVFYGAKVLVPLSLGLLVTVTGLYEYGALFVYAIALGLGFLMPDFWLGNRIKKRQLNIRLGLPEALDLMVICSEAGLGLDQSLQRVARELKKSQPEICDELTLIGLEQRAGLPRADALKNFADRTDVDSVRALVNTLIQADTFGTSIAKTLRVYSETLRTKRRQEAEERAAKTTVKLVFPLVLFIFPSLFLVTLGPSMIVMFEAFDKYLLN